jgi:hypothetical protein
MLKEFIQNLSFLRSFESDEHHIIAATLSKCLYIYPIVYSGHSQSGRTCVTTSSNVSWSKMDMRIPCSEPGTSQSHCIKKFSGLN